MASQFNIKKQRKHDCKYKKSEINLNNASMSNLSSPNSTESSICTSYSSEPNLFPEWPLVFDSHEKECRCAEFEYTVENQIRLRHKQIELIAENVPLAFDLLDRCQMLSQTAANSLFYVNQTCNNSQQGNGKPPPAPPGPQKPNSMCKCNSLFNLGTPKSKSVFKSPKSSNTKDAESLDTTLNIWDPSDASKNFLLPTFSTKLSNSLIQQPTQVFFLSYLKFPIDLLK